MHAEQYQVLKNSLGGFTKKKFSDQLELSCCRILPIINLTEEERKIVSNAVTTRRHEFSAGRRCARQCLRNSGISDYSLLSGKHGEPVWPAGVTGSITHNSGVAIAVTMPANKGRVGIDLVDLSDQAPDASLVLNAAELDSVIITQTENPELLLFSMKESIIKVISPLLRDYIEFKDINLFFKKDGVEISYQGNKMDINLFWLSFDHYAFTIAMKKQ